MQLGMPWNPSKKTSPKRIPLVTAIGRGMGVLDSDVCFDIAILRDWYPWGTVVGLCAACVIFLPDTCHGNDVEKYNEL